MKKILFLSTILSLLLSSCTQKVYLNEQSQVMDDQYDSEFPALPTARFLAEVNESIKQVNVMAYYNGFEFSRASGLKWQDVKSNNFENRAINEIQTNIPATGTATIIYSDPGKIALLTCSHVIFFPDTITSYFSDSNGDNTVYIQKIYFKRRHSINVSGIPGSNELRIIAMDENSDIAIIGKNYVNPVKDALKSLNYPKGKASELQVGVFVYLFGFPRGERLVTSNIIGQVGKGPNNRFVINTPMTNGISGGLVLAIRDGIPNFEVVGMVYAVAGEVIIYLTPDLKTNPSVLDAQQKYMGDIYLNSTKQVVYGITYATSIESIENFLEENRDEISLNGFNIEEFFSKK